MKKTLIILLFASLTVFLFGCGGEERHPVEAEDEQVTYNADDIIPGLSEILTSVGIDPKEANEMEQIEDWSNGPRYSFQTHGTTARIYCNMDGTVETIKVGVDIDLYKRGYENWTIDNFLVDEDKKEELITCCEDAVSACLSHPSSADFPLLDWSFGREFDHYYVNSSVKASNSFGVVDEIPFSAVFVISDGSIRLIGLQVNGETVKDETEQYPLPERAKLDIPDQVGKNGEIRLVDGELGEYGEAVTLDGWDYIWYHVPAGIYDATCNTKACMLYVDKDAITRNSSGYVEMENVETYELSYEETKEISVGEDEHIFLTINADITLIPKE